MIFGFFLFMFLSFLKRQTSINKLLPIMWQNKQFVEDVIQNSTHNMEQCIIDNKLKRTYCKQNMKQYVEERKDFFKDRKMIAISPGGYKGFYIFGIVSFIKDHYPMDNFIYSGASAGAWNSLFLTFKNTTDVFLEPIIQDLEKIKKLNTPHEIESYMKKTILTNYRTSDFELNRLFVGVTTIQNYTRLTNIYTEFSDLEDAIDCCIASSHIPFITGGMTNKYDNKFTFDGGFSTYPYLKIMTPKLYITPSIFKKNNNGENDPSKEKFSLKDTTTLFSRKDYDFFELYKKGYQDAQWNKDFLDKFLL